MYLESELRKLENNSAAVRFNQVEERGFSLLKHKYTVCHYVEKEAIDYHKGVQLQCIEYMTKFQ